MWCTPVGLSLNQYRCGYHEKIVVIVPSAWSYGKATEHGLHGTQLSAALTWLRRVNLSECQVFICMQLKFFGLSFSNIIAIHD